MTRPFPRKALLYGAAEVTATLVHYPPDIVQRSHEHERPQISFLLGGALVEMTRTTEAFSVRPSSGVKPGGQQHAARFGPSGALMLSLELATGEPVVRPACEWRALSPVEWRLVAQLLRARTPPEIRELTLDLSHLADTAPREPAKHPAPKWLAKVRETLDETPHTRIDAAARDAGVHRGHLTRAFAAAYGLPPSLYRARSLAMRGVSLALATPASLAEVAAETGFSDQSHMARTVGEHIGLPVSRLRRLLGHATSVQA